MIKTNEELYKHISKPVPLQPKKTCENDKARSWQNIEYNPRREIREFEYDEPEKYEIIPNNSLFKPDTKEIELRSENLVYQRDRNTLTPLQPKTLDLNKLLTENEEGCKPIRFNKPNKQFYLPLKEDTTLVFESRFESGNLDAVYKISETEYHLLLQNDINTKGNTQWFFFKTTNTTKGLSVRFNIVNLGKSGSLYNDGMKVLFHSEKSESLEKKHWQRNPNQVAYFANSLVKPNGKSYYSVSFVHTFDYSSDVVYFAYSYPYTYSYLMKYLLSVENSHERQFYMSRKSLCKTISGNRCECLTINDIEIPDNIKSRKIVFISARVHPGETVSSWIMHGIIDFLTGKSEEAAALRQKFSFKLIPMLNPDGVINGNYRTNLSGGDLNRKWKNPSKLIHPTIYHTKKLMKFLAAEREIQMVCDLHGHSRAMGTFIYGCTNFSFPEETRIYPLMLSRVSECFEFPSCSFKMQKSKESTLRISMFKELQIPNVFTLESSFAGHAGTHYSTSDLMKMGRDLCVALLRFSSDVIYRELICKEIKSKPELMTDSLAVSESDSDPSEDEFEESVISSLLPKIKVKVRKAKIPKLGHKNRVSAKQSLSEPRPKINSKKEPKLEPIKPKEIKKCEMCGEALMPGHNCLRKIQGISPTPTVKQRTILKSVTAMGNNLTYINAKGKTVRDQASQTVYIKKVASENYSVLNETTPEPRSLGRDFPFHRSIIDHKKLSQISSVLDVSGRKYRFHADR